MHQILEDCQTTDSENKLAFKRADDIGFGIHYEHINRPKSSKNAKGYVPG